MEILETDGMKILNRDINYGTELEIPIIKRMEDYFGEVISKAEDRFSPFDAYSDNTKYEIKSRRNRYEAFPTTIISCDKTRTKGRLIFVFHFTNGLFFIEYKEEIFQQFQIQNVAAVRKGGLRTLKPHYFIPIERLIKINV
jgi:hypothetical protein